MVGVVTSRQDYDELSGRNVEGVGFALSVKVLEGRLSFLADGGPALYPTPTPIPPPTPRPTPTPVPTPLPTGSWYTWEEIQDWGYESDQDGEPRILLQGTGLYSSLYTVYYLHVDCQVASDGNRVMNLYLTSNWIADLYLPIAGKFDDPVIYRVDGRASPSSRWSYYTNDDNRKRKLVGS